MSLCRITRPLQFPAEVLLFFAPRQIYLDPICEVLSSLHALQNSLWSGNFGQQGKNIKFIRLELGEFPFCLQGFSQSSVMCMYMHKG